MKTSKIKKEFDKIKKEKGISKKMTRQEKNQALLAVLKQKDLKRNKYGKHFYNAIRKYGPQNFKWIILGEIESYNMYDLIEQLNEAEKECIRLFRTFGLYNKCDNIYGYNQTKGG